ncbi:hypothetical protein Tco_0222297 [Tanacetum coccineum]
MASQSSSSELSSQQLEQNPLTLKACPNVHFEYEDVTIAFNNSIALLEYKFEVYKDLLLFLSNCCISKASTIKPSAMYAKYLKEFWFTTEVENDTITFSLSHIDKSFSFDRDLFTSVIGLDYTTDFVPPPLHDVVKEALATLGLVDEKRPNMTSNALANSSSLRISDLITKLSASGQKGRDQNVCYTRYLSIIMERLIREDYLNDEHRSMKQYHINAATFKYSSVSEVPLTSRIRKVAKLYEEGVAEDTSDKSFSETSVHPVSRPKPKDNKKLRKKKLPSSSEPKVSSIRGQSPTTQAFESQHAEEPKVTAETTQSLDISKSTEEQDYQPQTADAKKVQDKTVEETELINDDVDVVVEINETGQEEPESLYDNEFEILVVKRFQPTQRPFDTKSDMETNKSEDLDLHSLPDDEVQSFSKQDASDEEIMDQLESSIIRRVSDTLKEQLPELLSEALKTILPKMLKETIKESVVNSVEETLPLFYEQVKQTMTDQLPELVIKPMNKKFKVFNKMESNRFVHLQTKLSKFIHNQIRGQVKTKVRTGMRKVTKSIESLKTSTQENSIGVSDLRRKIKKMNSLLKATGVFQQTTIEGEKDTEKASDAQEEQMRALDAQEDQMPDKAEKPEDVDDAHGEQPESEENINDGTLVIHTSEQPEGEENINDGTLASIPLMKRSIFLEPTATLTPLRESTPPKDNKGKGIATMDQLMKQLLPLIKQGGSDLTMLNL